MKKALISFMILANCIIQAMENEGTSEKHGYNHDESENSMFSSDKMTSNYNPYYESPVITSPIKTDIANLTAPKKPISKLNGDYRPKKPSNLRNAISYVDLSDAIDDDLDNSIEEMDANDRIISPTATRLYCMSPEALIDDAVLAIAFGREEDIKKLLKDGLNPESIISGDISLIEAAESNGQEGIAKLLKGWSIKRKSVCASSNNEGWTELMEAVINEDKQNIELLIEQGEDINAQDIYGSTAISLAENCQDESIKKLLEEALKKK